MHIKSRLEFLERARSYIGTPFKHRGRDASGLDCAGLIVRSLQDLGYDPFQKLVYGREPHKDGLRETVETNMGAPIEGGIHVAKPGDFVLMKFSREPHHLAIIGDHPMGGLTVVHSYGDVGKVVEHIIDPVWKSRVISVYRFTTDEDVIDEVNEDGDEV